MKISREYRVCYSKNFGHDYGEVEFFSERRAGSNGNKEDALKAIGKTNSRVTIEQIYLLRGKND